MLIAIPTINEKVVTMRFGRMTEVTYVEVENHEILKQFSKSVGAGCHDDDHHHSGGHHHDHGDNDRHTDITNKLCEADLVVYKSMCKNWRARLEACSPPLMRTNSELLTDVLEELKSM